MKYLLFILFFLSSRTYSQSTDPDIWYNLTKRGDYLEQRYSKTTNLLTVVDTIPITYTEGVNDNNAWRYVKIVRYFYDEKMDVKKIYYTIGQTSDFYFYFEKGQLRKARVLKGDNTINQQFYYSSSENDFTPSQIEEKQKHYPDFGEKYELLKMARGFMDKFNSLNK